MSDAIGNKIGRRSCEEDPGGIAAGRHQGVSCEASEAELGERVFGKCAHQGRTAERKTMIDWTYSACRSCVRPNHVWAMNITYIPMARGFVYLTVVMDWCSRKVLSWRVSTTTDVHFCLKALEEAIGGYGTPEIMNADQGSQYTSQEFRGILKDHGIRISMHGKGAWRDNVFVERM